MGHQEEWIRIGFVDVGYLRGSTGKVPIEWWAPGRIAELSVVTDATFAEFEAVDQFEGEIRPTEDPSGLDVTLENWTLNYDLIVSWNGLFGDYLPLARLSDEVAPLVPKSVDLLRQLALDVADVFPEKKRPWAGLQLGKVYQDLGDDFALGGKYRGDSALDDCWRMLSIYTKVLGGAQLLYEHAAYRRAHKVVDDLVVIEPSERTLAALRGRGATSNDVRCDVNWATIELPPSVAALLDHLESWARKPVLRFALQLLAPSVNERLRAQISKGEPLSRGDLDRLRIAIESTP